MTLRAETKKQSIILLNVSWEHMHWGTLKFFCHSTCLLYTLVITLGNYIAQVFMFGLQINFSKQVNWYTWHDE